MMKDELAGKIIKRFVSPTEKVYALDVFNDECNSLDSCLKAVGTSKNAARNLTLVDYLQVVKENSIKTSLNFRISNQKHC